MDVPVTELDGGPAGAAPETPVRTGPAHRRADRRRSPGWPGAAVAFVVLFGASLATLALVRHQGVGYGGDEPYYLAAALAIGRFHTLNMDPAFHFAVAHHSIFPWNVPRGGNLDAAVSQVVPVFRHGILFPGHSIGLSALLALPMTIGTGVAVVTLVAGLSALAVGAVRLALDLADVESPWGYAVALLFLAPAYLLASTQVYPDLATGLALAVVVLLLALLEVRGRVSPHRLACGAVLLAVMPWLHQANALVVVLLIVAAVILYVRANVARSQLLWLLVPTILSLVALAVFNLWAYGHLLGPEQSVSPTGVDTFTRAVALLIDRRQGLLVALPLALLAFAALWLLRHRIPVFVTTCAVVVVATTYGNATQTISFGGGSFVGRFMWPVMPLLIVLAGLYLVRLWRLRPRAGVGLGALIALAFGAQWLPILSDEHVYFNQLAWDPTRYVGWWGGLDPSPVLGYITPTTMGSFLSAASNSASPFPAMVGSVHAWDNARNLWGTAATVSISILAVYVLVCVARRPAHPRAVRLGVLIGTSLVTVLATWHADVLLPGPARWPASSFLSDTGTVQGASRVATAPSRSGAVALGPYWPLLPGRYVTVVHYGVTGGQPEDSHLQVVALSGPHDQGTRILATEGLTTRSSLSSTFTVAHTETVVIVVTWGGTGTLRVDGVTLVKTGSSGH